MEFSGKTAEHQANHSSVNEHFTCEEETFIITAQPSITT